MAHWRTAPGPDCTGRSAGGARQPTIWCRGVPRPGQDRAGRAGAGSPTQSAPTARLSRPIPGPPIRLLSEGAAAVASPPTPPPRPPDPRVRRGGQRGSPAHSRPQDVWHRRRLYTGHGTHTDVGTQDRRILCTDTDTKTANCVSPPHSPPATKQCARLLSFGASAQPPASSRTCVWPATISWKTVRQLNESLTVNLA